MSAVRELYVRSRSQACSRLPETGTPRGHGMSRADLASRDGPWIRSRTMAIATSEAPVGRPRPRADRAALDGAAPAVLPRGSASCSSRTASVRCSVLAERVVSRFAGLIDLDARLRSTLATRSACVRGIRRTALRAERRSATEPISRRICCEHRVRMLPRPPEQRDRRLPRPRVRPDRRLLLAELGATRATARATLDVAR